MKKLLLLIFLSVSIPSWASATTWYVRPDTDGNGTDLNYGAEDGTSLANAFDGFASITGLAAGDTVCLPGGDEPFMHGEELTMDTSGTATAPITYMGCGSTPAIIWNATELSGNRSYDSAPAIVTSAAYAWVSDGNNIYHKRIDTLVRHLWEDSTWLQPIDIHQLSDATIRSTLTPGQFGNKDNGDGTFSLYYRATSTGSPTTTKIRCDYLINISLHTRAEGSYTIFKNAIHRGTGSFGGTIRGSHILWENLDFIRCKFGPQITSTLSPMSDVTLKNVRSLNPEFVGMYVDGLTNGLTNLYILGGEYSGASSYAYSGDGFTRGDGDGIGIGALGGTITNVVIQDIIANDNYNYALFVGTGFAFTLTNYTATGISMTGNISGCFAEGTSDNMRGTITLSGFLCNNNQGGTGGAPIAISNATPAASRKITICNGVFANNLSAGIIGINSHANNNYLFCNLVFSNNLNDLDIQTFGAAIGNEVFKNVYFNSFPNQHKRFARVNATNYYYDVGGDPAAFNAVTGSSNNTWNTDPKLISSTDFRTQGTSPLRRAGGSGGVCKDVRGRACYPDSPDIGAYQATSGDPAAARTAR